MIPSVIIGEKKGIGKKSHVASLGEGRREGARGRRWPLMKRLINFSGPLVEARGHAHAARRSRVHRHPSLSSILGPLATPRGEQFLKGPRVHRITRFFPLLFHRPFHSILSCIYLCSRSTAFLANRGASPANLSLSLSARVGRRPIQGTM